MAKFRLESFSDEVFAIVITLLILEVRPPSDQHFTFGALSSVGPSVAVFVVSFIIVGRYWVAHNTMSNFVKSTDRMLLWINLALLLAVVFIPFSAANLGKHLDDPPALALYGLNVITVNAAGTAFWIYLGSRPELRVDSASRAQVLRWGRVHASPIPFYAIGIAVGYWHVSLGLVFFALVSVFFILPIPVIDRLWVSALSMIGKKPD